MNTFIIASFSLFGSTDLFLLVGAMPLPLRPSSPLGGPSPPTQPPLHFTQQKHYNSSKCSNNKAQSVCVVRSIARRCVAAVAVEGCPAVAAREECPVAMLPPPRSSNSSMTSTAWRAAARLTAAAGPGHAAERLPQGERRGSSELLFFCFLSGS